MKQLIEIKPESRLRQTRLLPKKILKGPSELNAEKLGAQHKVHV